MAMTLDDLLGMNKRSQTKETTNFPSFEEFQNSRNYDRSQIERQNNENYTQAVDMDQVARPTFMNYNATAQENHVQNLYEFTRQDKDRLSTEEYFEKLSYTNDSRKPVFNKVDTEQVIEQKHGVFSHRAESKENEAVEPKKKSLLNVKGKLIIAAYVAVVATVAALIIVNSGKLNLGKATTPSSSIQDTAIVQIIDK